MAKRPSGRTVGRGERAREVNGIVVEEEEDAEDVKQGGRETRCLSLPTLQATVSDGSIEFVGLVALCGLPLSLGPSSAVTFTAPLLRARM